MKISKYALVCLILAAGFALEAEGKDQPCTSQKKILLNHGFEVTLTKFEPETHLDRLVLVLPPTGGTTSIDLSYAKALCAKNITAIVIDRWSQDDEYAIELEIHGRFYRRAQRAIDLVLSNSNESNIGILGTSVGGSHAAIASQRNGRINSVFLIVNGAPISSILATSDQKILVDGKAKRFQKYGFRSVDEYEVALKNVIPFEPLSMSPRKARKLGMAISNNDGTVPTRLQKTLRDAWKPSLVLESNFGHIGTVIKTWLFDKEKIVAFFDETL